MSDITYDQMLELVAEDVRGNLDEKSRKLLHEDKYLNLRYYALLSLKQSVESQLTANKSRTHKARMAFEMGLSVKEIDPSDDEDFSFETEEQFSRFISSRTNWRVKAIRFLKAIEKEIISVKSRRQELYSKNNEVKTLGAK